MKNKLIAAKPPMHDDFNAWDPKIIKKIDALIEEAQPS